MILWKLILIEKSTGEWESLELVEFIRPGLIRGEERRSWNKFLLSRYRRIGLRRANLVIKRKVKVYLVILINYKIETIYITLIGVSFFIIGAIEVSN